MAIPNSGVEKELTVIEFQSGLGRYVMHTKPHSDWKNQQIFLVFLISSFFLSSRYC